MFYFYEVGLCASEANIEQQRGSFQSFSFFLYSK